MCPPPAWERVKIRSNVTTFCQKGGCVPISGRKKEESDNDTFCGPSKV